MDNDRKQSYTTRNSDNASSSDESSGDEGAERPDDTNTSTADAVDSYYSAHIASVCEAVNAEAKIPQYSPSLTRAERRRQANRLSAKRCRKRRREEIQRLENDIRNLTADNELWESENETLKTVLQEEISNASSQIVRQEAILERQVEARPFERLGQLSLLQHLQSPSIQGHAIPSLQNVPPYLLSQLLPSGGFQPNLPTFLPIPGMPAHSNLLPSLATPPPTVVAAQLPNELNLIALLASNWPNTASMPISSTPHQMNIPAVAAAAATAIAPGRQTPEGHEGVRRHIRKRKGDGDNNDPGHNRNR